MDVPTAKSARTAAKRIFNRHIKKVNDSLDENDPLQLIEARFHDMKKLWDDIQEKHEKDIEAQEGSKGEYDATAEDKWIDTLDGVYESVVRKRLGYLKIIECARKEEEEKQMEIAREQEKKQQKQESDRKIAQAAIAREVEEVAFKQEVENLDKFRERESKSSIKCIGGCKGRLKETTRAMQGTSWGICDVIGHRTGLLGCELDCKVPRYLWPRVSTDWWDGSTKKGCRY